MPTTILDLWLNIASNTKWVRQRKRVIDQIESFYLSTYGAKKLGDRRYQLTVPYLDRAQLKQIVEELIHDMWATAEDRNCQMEFSIDANEFGQHWD